MNIAWRRGGPKAGGLMIAVVHAGEEPENPEHPENLFNLSFGLAAKAMPSPHGEGGPRSGG